MSPIPETGPIVTILLSTTLFHPRQTRKGILDLSCKQGGGSRTKSYSPSAIIHFLMFARNTSPLTWSGSSAAIFLFTMLSVMENICLEHTEVPGTHRDLHVNVEKQVFVAMRRVAVCGDDWVTVFFSDWLCVIHFRNRKYYSLDGPANGWDGKQWNKTSRTVKNALHMAL